MSATNATPVPAASLSHRRSSLSICGSPPRVGFEQQWKHVGARLGSVSSKLPGSSLRWPGGRYDTARPKLALFAYPYSKETSRMRILILGGDGYLGWPTAMH